MASPRPAAETEQLAKAAVEAAERGWAIFPCQPGGKRPCIERWEQRASANPAHIAAAWRGRWHGCNVGIACGPSGLVVLDLDGTGHMELPADWRELPGVGDGRDVLVRLAEWADQPWPATFTVATPGGGWHCYFRATDGAKIRNSAGRLGPLVDVRGRGGYIIGPGSLIAGRVYGVIDGRELAVLPAWLRRLAEPDPHPASTARAAGPLDAAGARIRGLLAHVAAGEVGDRNGRLYWAACRAGELAAAGRVDKETIMEQLVTAGLAAGLRGGEREARRTVASGMRAGGAQ